MPAFAEQLKATAKRTVLVLVGVASRRLIESACGPVKSKIDWQSPPPVGVAERLPAASSETTAKA
jgi:hypothetical protein